MEPPERLLKSPEFWKFYFHGEDAELEESFVERFARRDEEDEELFEPVVLRFPVDDCTLEIEMSLDFYTINLGLRRGERERELGWIDHARWHPCALRWDEYTALRDFWERSEERPFRPCEPTVLLAPFVGHGAGEQSELESRRAYVRNALVDLGLLEDELIDGIATRVVAGPPEPDYEWTRDDELGWVFGGEYPCYSIRNREHAGGEEGWFAFDEMKRLRDILALDEITPDD